MRRVAWRIDLWRSVALPSHDGHVDGEVMQSIMAWYKSQGFTTLKYKPVPHHYADYPCEEDLYWLFRHDAQLTVRLIASVVDLAQPYAFSTLRRRKVNKANRLGTLQEAEGINFLTAYWQVLEKYFTLATMHALCTRCKRCNY